MQDHSEKTQFAPRLPLRQEIGRKLIHVLGFLLPVAYVLFGRGVMIPLMLLGCILVLGADVARLYLPPAHALYVRLFGRLTRSAEEQRLTGASVLMIGQTLAVLLFPPVIAPAAMTFGVTGDVAAALIGARYGRLHWRQGKSIAGIAACLVAAFLGGLVWGRLAWPVVLAGAGAATLAEALPVRLDDNLTIPLVGGAVMWALVGLGR